MDEKAAENKNSFQKKNYITYHCPHCEEPFAEGVLLNIKVICPNCEKLIIILEMTVKRYGSNNLTIEQMHSSRTEAIAAGHAHYFTGKPCKHGHIEIRDAKNTDCLACRQVRYQKNREKILQYMKKHAEENKDQIKKRKRQHFQANREKYRESSRKWSENNKEKLAAYKKKYRENNKEKISAYQKKYREDNKEKMIAYRKIYYKNNREKISAYNRKRYHELKEQL